MRMSRLRETAASYYFWPGIALAGLAAGMAVWAVTLWRQDWAGQVMWSAFFALAASGLLVLAFRESHPATGRPGHERG